MFKLTAKKGDSATFFCWNSWIRYLFVFKVEKLGKETHNIITNKPSCFQGVAETHVRAMEVRNDNENSPAQWGGWLISKASLIKGLSKK